MRLGTAIERLVDNYRYASDKEWINDKVAWALYHTWKEAVRKTENSSEKPNNCEPQTYVINPQEPTNDDKCFECDDFFTCGGQCNKIKDEPTISKMEQVDKDINVRSKDEPQTERSE